MHSQQREEQTAVSHGTWHNPWASHREELVNKVVSSTGVLAVAMAA